MSFLFYNEQQLEQIDNIVRSTSDLVELLNRNVNLDETIINTITHIFTFIDKITIILPEILILSGKHSNIKKDVNISLNSVLDAWKTFSSKPTAFYVAWGYFYYNWQRFYKHLNEMKKSGNTVYLCLN